MGIYVVYVAEDEPGGSGSAGLRRRPRRHQYRPGHQARGPPDPVPFRIPLTGLDTAGHAVEIKGPPGRFRRLRSGANVRVGDRFFSRPNIRLRQGARLNCTFRGAELHNLTLANGPMGIGSPNLTGGRIYTQRFTRPVYTGSSVPFIRSRCTSESWSRQKLRHRR